MSLFPVENIVTKEIESWKVLADCLKDKKTISWNAKEDGIQKECKKPSSSTFLLSHGPT
jgi:hypothetical protein